MHVCMYACMHACMFVYMYIHTYIHHITLNTAYNNQSSHVTPGALRFRRVSLVEKSELHNLTTFICKSYTIPSWRPRVRAIYLVNVRNEKLDIGSLSRVVQVIAGVGKYS